MIFTTKLFSSVAQLCPTLCDSVDCSTPGLLVHHQLQEFTQTHVYRVSDAIQPVSSSVVPFSSCLQSFPASGSFQMSQLFASGGQSIGVSASTSVLPINIQDWSPLGWTGWISLQCKGLSRVFSERILLFCQNKLNLQFWGWPPGGNMCIWYSLSASSIVFWRQRINVSVFFTFLQF